MIAGIVAIIGRPNVGKSTLFNRMTRSTKAIVDDQPGITRDRIFGTVSSVEDDDAGFLLIDTGGFETKDLYYQPFTNNIVWEQTQVAISDADVVLMVLDGKTGVHPHDFQLVTYLKEKNKNVIYVVNKMDGKEHESNALEFYELGIDKMTHVSAAHNRGVWDLCAEIESNLKEKTDLKSHKADVDGAARIAIIGRPNAGKSSILNRLCGEERSLVSEIAGTTRDTIDTHIVFNKKPYTLLDTAGVRRRKKIFDKIEGLSVMRSLRTIEDADVVVLVIAADEGLSDQDARLATLALSKFKPLLIVVNKWDLFPNKETNSSRDYTLDIQEKLRDATFVPVIFASCLENQRIHKIMAAVEELYSSYEKRVSTGKVNDALQRAVLAHTPAILKRYSKRVKFYFATQVSSKPPTIVVKCNVAEEIQESYKRFLVKRLRTDLEYGDIPIRVFFRAKSEDGQRPDRLDREVESELNAGAEADA
jgi:GTP-binding protein